MPALVEFCIHLSFLRLIYSIPGRIFVDYNISASRALNWCYNFWKGKFLGRIWILRSPVNGRPTREDYLLVHESITIFVCASITGKLFCHFAHERSSRTFQGWHRRIFDKMDPGRYARQQGWENNSVIVVSLLITYMGWYTGN